jgi:hypothetical protein
VKQAQQYQAEGYRWVVDLVSDKRLLKLIRASCEQEL